MNRHMLIQSLLHFKTTFEEELKYIPRFIELLAQPRCFYRDHLPGHITASSWIVNPDRTEVVLVRHASLNKWLQPGGHADGDENILQVARREAWEETGLKELSLLRDSFFDIDIHAIPPKKDFPSHEHFDLRFLFLGKENQELRINDESTDLKWIALDDLEKFNPEPSVVRMKYKSILR